MTTVAWAEVLSGAARDLAAAGVLNAAREARWMVEEASGYEGAELEAHLEVPATQRTLARLDAMVQRRVAGEPLQYVLGSWAFRALDLFVDRRVLIPRPETEQLVDVALAELDRAHPPPGRPQAVVDLGTGSGAIGLSVAAERPDVEVWLTDRSEEALDVARANLAGIGRAGRHVRVAAGSWFDALPPSCIGALEVVVSNPPYIAEHEALPPEVADWEPASALVAGRLGTECILEIAGAAPRWLAPGGSLVVEIAPHQAEAAEQIAVGAGMVAVDVLADLAGRARILRARRPG